MLNPAAGFALLAPLAFAVGISTTEPARLNCRNSTQTTPIYMLDGRSSSDSAIKIATTERAAFVVVTCLNPADSSTIAFSAAIEGIPAIVVWTKDGPVSQLKPALKALVDAQDANFAKSKKYATQIEALKLNLPAGVVISMAGTESGWSAVAKIDRLMSPTCVAFDGDAPTPREMARIPGTPHCKDF